MCIWLKKEVYFYGEYRDKKKVHIYYNFEVKFNFSYLRLKKEKLIKIINDSIQNFFEIFIDKKFMFEGQDTRRLIDDYKLEITNKHINTIFNLDWCPKGIKVRNIKITTLV